jgi:hypothetical protein
VKKKKMSVHGYPTDPIFSCDSSFIFIGKSKVKVKNLHGRQKPNFAQIGGFLYFGGHFGIKMTAIVN